MTTPHDGCACSHDQLTDDTNLPLAGMPVATGIPANDNGCRGDGGGGCCGHAA